MIVQCGQCSTKFRLDDAKVKESGVKVRCSKCRNIFIVYPQAPSFDEQVPDYLTSADDEDAAVDQHADAQQQDTAQSAYLGSSRSISPSDVDDWFAPTPTEASANGEAAPEGFDFEAEPSPAEPQPEEPVVGGGTSDDFDFFQADAVEPSDDLTFGEGAVKSYSTTGGAGKAEPEVSGFDFEVSDARQRVEEGAEEIFAAPPEDRGEDLGFDDADAGGTSASLVDFQFDEVEQDATTVARSGLAGGSSEAPEGVEVGAEEELPPLSIPSRRRTHSAIPILVTIISVVFVLILAVGGFLFMSEGPQGMKKMGLGFLTEWAGLQQVDDGAISIRATTAEFVVNKEAGELFVVRGEAVNGFKKPRASIQVRAVVYNAKGEVVARKTAFCGNALTKEQVATLPIDKIDAAIGNQFGDSLSNLSVQPGKAIPFVVVLPQVPKDAADYAVEIAGSTVASQ